MRSEHSLCMVFRKRLLERSGLLLLIGVVVFSSGDLPNRASAASASVSATCQAQGASVCITQATAQINRSIRRKNSTVRTRLRWTGWRILYLSVSLWQWEDP